MLLEPYQMLEVMPMLARLKPSATNTRSASGRATTSATSARETLLKGTMPRASHGLVRRGSIDALGIEANGDIKGCPSLPTATYVGGNIRDRSLRGSGSRPRRYASRATAPWTTSSRFCRDCYYNDVRAPLLVDDARALRQAGQQPVLPPPRWSCSARASAKQSFASRGERAAVRSRALRDRRGGLPPDELERARDRRGEEGGSTRPTRSRYRQPRRSWRLRANRSLAPRSPVGIRNGR